MPPITVVGAGLAGAEAAYQLAARGLPVTLVEMRPAVTTPAHETAGFAELVCSNSFKGTSVESAAGALKRELETLGSFVLAAARATAIPAGAALAVDRASFSATITRVLESHPRIRVERREAAELPDEGEVVVATGPLTSDAFSAALSDLVGEERLSFFDAAAPIVDGESVDRSRVFAASRYDRGGGADYLNCPMDEIQYAAFHSALTGAERVRPPEFDRKALFQACQPVEEIASTGPDSLRFGPLKPVGLIDPDTGERPFAVVQLRPENRDATAYNLVGFQTSLTFSEQRRVFRLIPGLAGAEFLRFGVMHRNTFVDSPRVLAPGLWLRSEPRVFLAGQVTGTEGYLEAAAGGLLAALNIAARRTGEDPCVLPAETVLGALFAYATDPATSAYQPMHVNFGLLPPLDPPVAGKRKRRAAYTTRAAEALHSYLDGRGFGRVETPELS